MASFNDTLVTVGDRDRVCRGGGMFVRSAISKKASGLHNNPARVDVRRKTLEDGRKPALNYTQLQFVLSLTTGTGID